MIYEVFVLEVQYLPSIEKKRLTQLEFGKSSLFKDKSHYTYEYWKDIKSPFYQRLPESVEKAIANTFGRE